MIENQSKGGDSLFLYLTDPYLYGCAIFKHKGFLLTLLLADDGLGLLLASFSEMELAPVSQSVTQQMSVQKTVHGSVQKMAACRRSLTLHWWMNIRI